MAKRLFRVLSGSHDEGGKIYQKGEEVSSERDLVSMFANKFEAVGDFTPAVVETPDPAPPTKKPVELIETTTDENKIFRTHEPKPSGPSDDSKVDLDSTDHGIDITEEFQSAVDAGLHVYKRRGWCTVVDDGVKVNGKGLKQADVGAFIDTMLKGEDDEDF